ncbi:hypothetical protein D3C75_1058040 [compost metagenome]
MQTASDRIGLGRQRAIIDRCAKISGLGIGDHFAGVLLVLQITAHELVQRLTVRPRYLEGAIGCRLVDQLGQDLGNVG